MTPLRPLETARVRGVASTRYPLNQICSMPECDQPAVDPHHIWPRSLISGDSWFVEVVEGDEAAVFKANSPSETALPHVTGLCRAHHDDVEAHRTWIKLEDGEFVWYDREMSHDGSEVYDHWLPLGSLSPQPGSREGKPKRKKFKGEKPRNRVSKSIRVPKDEQEDGVEILETLIDLAAEKRGKPDVPPYYTLVDSLHFFVTNYAEGTDG